MCSPLLDEVYVVLHRYERLFTSMHFPKSRMDKILSRTRSEREESDLISPMQFGNHIIIRYLYYLLTNLFTGSLLAILGSMICCGTYSEADLKETIQLAMQKLFIGYPRLAEWVHQYRLFLEYNLPTGQSHVEENRMMMVNFTSKIVAILPKALESQANNNFFFTDLLNVRYRNNILALFHNIFKNPNSPWISLNPLLLCKLIETLCSRSATSPSTLLQLPRFFEYCQRLFSTKSDADGLPRLTLLFLQEDIPIDFKWIDPLRAVWSW